ncbi:hypothetical protein AAXE64_07745 [Priestia megaterium]
MNLGTPEIFVEAQKELFGHDHSYPMIAFGTFKHKSAFKMYARARNLDFDVANAITKQIEKYETELKYAEEDEKDLINVYDYVEEKYHEYVKGSEKYRGIISDKKPHPCAHVLYQGSIRRELGLMKIKSQQGKKETMVTVIDGYVAEKYKFLKNDLLKVDVVNTIHKTYEKIGRPQHTINELVEVTKDDDKTWSMYERGLTLGINQVEKPSTTHKVKQYKPQNVSELTAFVAAIRPSFKSMYNIFEKRQDFSYGIKAFDDIIQTEEMPYSFVLYQEQMMATLQYAGFPVDETYSIIKAISKKKPEIVIPLKQRFIDGFSLKIKESDDVSDEEAKQMSDKVWRIIEDSSNYGFNSSHAYSYAFDSLYGAYLKANYPYEFYSVMLNTYTEKGEKEKVTAFIKEMDKGFNIKLGELRFGLDNREFSIDKENGFIHPNLSSIKFLNQNIAQELYDLRDQKYDTFSDLIFDLHNNTGCTFKHIKILVSLHYFKDFGKNGKLLQVIEQYEKKLKNKGLKEETKQNRLIEMREFESELEDMTISIKDQIKFEIEYLGQESTTVEKSPASVYIITSIDTKYTPKIRAYCLKTGEVLELKCYKNKFQQAPFGEFAIIQIKKKKQREKQTKVGDKWIGTGEIEFYLDDWNILR